MSSVNCSRNNYLLVEDFSNPLNSEQRVILAAVYLIIAVGSVVGNVWTLVNLRKRAYGTLYKCCLASLAISDLTIGVFVSLDNTTRLVSPDIGWLLGDGMCNTVPLLTTAGILVSSFTLTCVAADRYHGLAWLHEHFKPSLITSIGVMFVLWGISFGASVQMFFIYTPVEFCIVNLTTFNCEACATLCLSSSSDYSTYFTCLYAAIFLPLLGVFLSSYCMIAKRVWGARRQAGRPGHTPSTTTSTTELGTSAEPNGPKAPKTAHTKKKLRTFRVVLVIMAAFVVCRLPHWTFTLVTLQTPIGGTAGYLARYCLSILTVFNTAINPLLYSFLESVLNFHCGMFRC